MGAYGGEEGVLKLNLCCVWIYKYVRKCENCLSKKDGGM
jgi:hypothetical protein